MKKLRKVLKRRTHTRKPDDSIALPYSPISWHLPKEILPLEQKSKPDSEEGESNCKREMEIDNFPDLKKDSDAEIQKAKNVSEMKTEFAGEMEIDNFPDLSMNPWERKL